MKMEFQGKKLCHFHNSFIQEHTPIHVKIFIQRSAIPRKQAVECYVLPACALTQTGLNQKI